MLLPLHDKNPLRVLPFQIVTASLMALAVIGFALQLAGGWPEQGQGIIDGFALVPVSLLGGDGGSPLAELWTLLTYTFLHADFWHLAGNLLFLWVFGDNVEDAMGHLRFLVFFLLCGAVAGLAHALGTGDSTIGLVGASGAISGVLGAYLMLHPKVKVLVLVLKWFPVFLPAYFVLGAWVVLQFVGIAMSANGDASGVAFGAHLGGFVAGLVLVPFFRRADVPLFDRGVEH